MAESDDDTLHAAVRDLSAADPGRRAAAAERLAHAGTLTGDAVVAVVLACGDDDDTVREWAVAALEDAGAPPEAVIPDLASLAAASPPLVAYWAITLLGRTGQAAATAVDTLAKCIASKDLAVAQRAAWALGKIGPRAAAAVSALRDATARGDERLTRLAAEAIAAIGA